LFTQVEADLLRVPDFGLARLRPDVARSFFVAGFVALRVELVADFVTACRFGVDFFVAALAGARFFAGDFFAFMLRLVGWVLDRRLRAPQIPGGFKVVDATGQAARRARRGYFFFASSVT
jgi:hypothetical protein